MKLLLKIIATLTHNTKKPRRSVLQYQQDVFNKQGREQFKKLLKFGQMPVTFL